jgi:hypothetical protein
MTDKQSSIDRLIELIKLTNKEVYAELFTEIEELKEMYKDEMEVLIIKEIVEASTSRASSYADGYSEGYKRALEYMYQVIYTQIKIKE